jgi:hypothetical protein
MLIYGESGTGKTTLAGSADSVPNMRPVIFIDIEGGTVSLTHSYPKVETVRVTTWKDMQKVYDELRQSRTHGYQTVVCDSLTEIQKFNMYDVMDTAFRKRPEGTVEIEVPAQRDWGVSLEQTRKMIRGFRDLPMHTIFTALAKDDRNPKTGIVTVKPSLPGKLASEVAAFLDIVMYYYVKEVKGPENKTEFRRLLLTQKTDTEVAKDRSGKLPQVIESPTMSTINTLMKGTPQ